MSRSEKLRLLVLWRCGMLCHVSPRMGTAHPADAGPRSVVVCCKARRKCLISYSRQKPPSSFRAGGQSRDSLGFWSVPQNLPRHLSIYLILSCSTQNSPLIIASQLGTFDFLREYGVSEKEIVEIKDENTAKKSRGFLNPRLVKIITFSVLCLGLVSCSVLIILAIWGYAQNDTVWKSIATIVVVMISVALFSVINEKFG